MTGNEARAWTRRRLIELALAFGLLTRLPVPRLAVNERIGVASFVWAYPIAGLAVGAVGGIALWLTRLAGATPAMAAIAALIATILATGALHEDGLADFWDGIGGGRTRERKLEVMRDSAIGSFGAAALIAGFAVRWTALSEISNPALAIGALIAAHTAARGLLALVFQFSQPARSDGLAATPGGSWVRSGAAVLIAAAIAFVFGGGSLALAALIAAAVAITAIAIIAGRQLGGFTGDVLGAAEQTAEALVLAVAATLLAH